LGFPECIRESNHAPSKPRPANIGRDNLRPARRVNRHDTPFVDDVPTPARTGGAPSRAARQLGQANPGWQWWVSAPSSGIKIASPGQTKSPSPVRAVDPLPAGGHIRREKPHDERRCREPPTNPFMTAVKPERTGVGCPSCFVWLTPAEAQGASPSRTKRNMGRDCAQGWGPRSIQDEEPWPLATASCVWSSRSLRCHPKP
jgi:hypothetical protein